MEARVHYSRPLLQQQQGPAESPAAPAAATTGAVPDSPSVPEADASSFLNDNATIILAILVAALALRVVQGALRATRRACHDDEADEASQEPGHNIAGGEGGAGQQAAAGHGGKLAWALPCLAYSARLELAGSSQSECAICLAAFARGDVMRVLPRCGHGFHARCIDRWLAARPTCPTCRQAAFAETTAVLQPVRSAPAVVSLVRVAIVRDRGAHLVEP